MPPEIHPVNTPETPHFWMALQDDLVEAAKVHVHGPDLPPLPLFERDVIRRLDTVQPAYAEPRFPPAAAAAIASIVLLTAMAIQLLPGLAQQREVAAPGTTPVVEEPDPVPVSAEQLVVNSFRRFADDRSEADELASQLRNRGYEVTVAHQTVTDPKLHGAVLEVRHASDISDTALTGQDVRGPVILVVAQAPTTRPVS